jgi:hypothetical protein
MSFSPGMNSEKSRPALEAHSDAVIHALNPGKVSCNWSVKAFIFASSTGFSCFHPTRPLPQWLA